jgi:hypothetical protein
MSHTIGARCVPADSHAGANCSGTVIKMEPTVTQVATTNTTTAGQAAAGNHQLSACRELTWHR